METVSISETETTVTLKVDVTNITVANLTDRLREFLPTICMLAGADTSFDKLSLKDREKFSTGFVAINMTCQFQIYQTHNRARLLNAFISGQVSLEDAGFPELTNADQEKT